MRARRRFGADDPSKADAVRFEAGPFHCSPRVHPWHDRSVMTPVIDNPILSGPLAGASSHWLLDECDSSAVKP